MGEDETMPSTKGPYPEEFRQRIVELVRSGRSQSSIRKEFSVTQMTIRKWLRQADADEGRSGKELKTTEKEELARLRRENARLREERDILKKAATWFAQEAATMTPKKRSDS